jgi:hypothetical protein
VSAAAAGRDREERGARGEVIRLYYRSDSNAGGYLADAAFALLPAYLDRQRYMRFVRFQDVRRIP